MNPTKNYIARGFIHAASVVLYVTGVALFLANAKYIFGEKEPEGIVIPVFMLLLLIISATITGLLVLGKPVHLYLSGMKQEAIRLLLATLAWLVFFVLVLAITIAMLIQ